jgi:hypothetical protein
MKLLLELKIGRKTYPVTTKSVFVDNGACVQLIAEEMDRFGKQWIVLTNKALKEIAPFRSNTIPSQWGNCTCFILSEVEDENK